MEVKITVKRALKFGGKKKRRRKKNNIIMIMIIINKLEVLVFMLIDIIYTLMFYIVTK